MAITDWPLQERPREKLMSLGPNALSEAELLAIFLRTGTRGKTAVDLARDLLVQFKGLRNLLESSKNQFCQQRGLGLAKYVQLQAVLEMSRRHLRAKLENSTSIHTADETKNLLIALLRHHQREVFACLFLDAHHRMLGFEELFFGTVDCAHVHPREVVKRALSHNAAAVILAHNHPSGVAAASLADKEITWQLIKALKLVDVRVLDHMIIGEDQVLSLAELGDI